MEYKDYYKTLGIDKGASAEDVKKAYRKLVRKYHPDVSKAPDADHKTKEVNEAYGVLGDADKRAAYDALGRTRRAGEPFQPPPDWGSGFDGGAAGSNDFFSDLFAHVGRRARPGGQSFQMRGDDIHAAITIDLSDAYHGSTRAVTLRVPEHDAQGRVVTRERVVNVKIPKGVLPGQQLRLAGQGHPGSGGAGPGDLFLEIQFHPDPRYRVEGRHVYASVPVTPWEAALGASIGVPTPSGQVEVAVPPGSQTGRKLRLKGRGIPGTPAGDLYLILEVVLPPANTDKARELYRAMARELAFNPRAQAGA
ncbi:DnaJ C-terminal domain-containing protein [Massilia pseudoviolaceinigra]|uniref:DnaJ C-terminal domain-containing protein n=1 Tax=Massilia pseudoviolaceinigra TaxID=3057165 RepID=UPI002796DCC1|nr:DnaJ C-terminal domain-containing protein [Massilia sp. CCM 9206]MDQ1924441.1 DnaJ C-terminal domain-containing protein [Massilia sp. CCM 9206]